MMMINSQSFAAAAAADDDDDFRDVFGGPPRRTIIRRRTRRGRSGEDEETNYWGRENVDESSPWHPKSSEQPVFGGDEGAIRNPRRYPSKDFFDDIFRGDDSSCSTPNKAVDRDPFSSAPGSRTLSPSRPLQPADDPDPSCLPKKLAKEVEFGSVITSFNHGPSKGNDSASNAVGYAYSLSNLSRFSSQSVHSQEKARNEFGVLYCESPLSRSLRVAKSDETVVDLKKSAGVSDACIRDSKFHFSIFRWVSKGIPSLRPLRGVRSLGSEKKGQSGKTSSSNGSIENCSVNELYTANMHGKGFTTENCVECKNQESYSFLNEKKNNAKSSSTGDGEEEQCEIIEEAFLSMLETESSTRLSNFVEAVAVNGMCHNTREEPGPHSLPQISVCGEKNEVSMPEVDDDEWKISDMRETKNGVRRTVKEKSINMESQENVKEVDRAGVEDLQTKSIGTAQKNRSEGKVRNFVKMFNQEASSEPEINHHLQRRSSRWKGKDGFRVKKQADFHKMGTDGKMQNYSVDQKKAMSHGFIAFEGHFKPMMEQHSGVKNTIHESSEGNYSPAAVSVTDGSEAAFSMGESFEENLVSSSYAMVALMTDKLVCLGYGQASDVQIQLWANGKEGNIRSLLSTLQFVLWPESGWKTVALVDIIEVNAVRRAYQKALLCLHPDKLQQKGAASHQKYIAEKIFDILQDAWTHFNSLGSL